MSELPLYTCHKKVRAGKIVGIRKHLLSVHNIDSERFAILPISEKWIKRHKPEVGGYLVRYEDGYMSYSPAKAFEEGYTKDKE